MNYTNNIYNKVQAATNITTLEADVLKNGLICLHKIAND